MASDSLSGDMDEVSISLSLARWYAFSYIPGCVTVEVAHSLLLGLLDLKLHGLTPADLRFICRVHAEDQEVLSWRVDEAYFKLLGTWN